MAEIKSNPPYLRYYEDIGMGMKFILIDDYRINVTELVQGRPYFRHWDIVPRGSTSTPEAVKLSPQSFPAWLSGSDITPPFDYSLMNNHNNVSPMESYPDSPAPKSEPKTKAVKIKENTLCSKYLWEKK